MAGDTCPTGVEVVEAIQANPGYQGIKAPRNLRHRYIFEDVPFSLVPLASLGAQFGVDTWAADAMIRLACVVHGTNYYERGRTVEDVELKGLRAGEVKRYPISFWLYHRFLALLSDSISLLTSSPFAVSFPHNVLRRGQDTGQGRRWR